MVFDALDKVRAVSRNADGSVQFDDGTAGFGDTGESILTTKTIDEKRPFRKVSLSNTVASGVADLLGGIYVNFDGTQAFLRLNDTTETTFRASNPREVRSASISGYNLPTPSRTESSLVTTTQRLDANPATRTLRKDVSALGPGTIVTSQVAAMNVAFQRKTPLNTDTVSVKGRLRFPGRNPGDPGFTKFTISFPSNRSGAQVVRYTTKAVPDDELEAKLEITQSPQPIERDETFSVYNLSGGTDTISVAYFHRLNETTTLT